MAERARVPAPGDLALVVADGDMGRVACWPDLGSTRDSGLWLVASATVTVLSGPQPDPYRIPYVLVMAAGCRPVWALPEDLVVVDET